MGYRAVFRRWCRSAGRPRPWCRNVNTVSQRVLLLFYVAFCRSALCRQGQRSEGNIGNRVAQGCRRKCTSCPAVSHTWYKIDEFLRFVPRKKYRRPYVTLFGNLLFIYSYPLLSVSKDTFVLYDMRLFHTIKSNLSYVQQRQERPERSGYCFAMVSALRYGLRAFGTAMLPSACW